VVLEHGWAFGTGGTALSGKTLQLAVTTCSKVEDYQSNGRHNFTLEEFLRPFEQTARLCHMTWREAFWVPGTHGMSASAMAERRSTFGDMLTANGSARAGGS